MEDRIKGGFLGLAVADALGVPVEFKEREELKEDPVTGMRAFGTHHQPAGTWSDDSALAFCLADALLEGYDLGRIADNIIKWYDEGYWSAHGKVFDVGIYTAQAIENLKKGIPPMHSGNTEEGSNGNGSLMRIFPVLFLIKDKPIDERFKTIAEISSITHAHIRSVIACFIYIEFAISLYDVKDIIEAYIDMQKRVVAFLQFKNICSIEELNKFHRILEIKVENYEVESLLNCEEVDILSNGYVINTLEASIWCFIKSKNYREVVLKAVNLGKDTDTVACIAGGLAGFYYGANAIPQEWLEVLARRNDICLLAMSVKDTYRF